MLKTSIVWHIVSDFFKNAFPHQNIVKHEWVKWIQSRFKGIDKTLLYNS